MFEKDGSTAMTAETDAPIYIYDGHCVLCSGAVQYVFKHDRSGRIRFVAITSAEGRRIARENGVDPDDPHTFVFVDGRGVAHLSSEAAFELAEAVGGPWRLLRPFRWLPRSLRDWAYARVAKNRYRFFGRTEQCLLPDPETRARFTLV